MAVCQLPLRCLSQQKNGVEEEGSTIVRVAYLSLIESFYFILGFLSDSWKDNLVILVI